VIARRAEALRRADPSATRLPAPRGSTASTREAPASPDGDSAPATQRSAASSPVVQPAVVAPSSPALQRAVVAPSSPALHGADVAPPSSARPRTSLGVAVDEPQPARRLARVPSADLPRLLDRARALRSAAAMTDESTPHRAAVLPAGSPQGAAVEALPERVLPGAPATALARARAIAPASPSDGDKPARPQLLPAPSRQPPDTADAEPQVMPSAPSLLQRETVDDSTPIDAAALAFLTGGALAEAGPGSSTVSFLGRSADPRPAPAQATTIAPAAKPAAATASAESCDAIGVDAAGRPVRVDDLYDRILKRLRRELLDDRERRGRLNGEGRW
jgi:hypothetical protein